MSQIVSLTVLLVWMNYPAKVAYGGCCTVNLNFCVDKLPQACRSPDILDDSTPNVLYSCLVGKDPIYITQCDFECRTPAGTGQAGVCSSGEPETDSPTQTTSTASTTSRLLRTVAADSAKFRPEIRDNSLIAVVAKQLGLSSSAVNILEHDNYITVADLKVLSGDDLEALGLPKADFSIIRDFLHLPATETIEVTTTTSTTKKRITTARMIRTKRITSTAKPPDTTEDDSDGGGETDTSPSTADGTDVIGSSSNVDTRSPAVQKLIVDIVNEHRKRVKAANMMKIAWSPVAAEGARAHVAQCKIEVNKKINSSGTTMMCGQNIAAGNGFHNWQEVFDAWTVQKSDFLFGKEPCSAAGKTVGSYTQVVWAHTYQIGCAMAACPPDGPFYTCHFCPRGNFNGKCQPYQEGTPANGGICGKCGGLNGENCNDGLCTNPCPYENLYKECDALYPDMAACNSASVAPKADVPNKDGCQATCKCRQSGLIYWIN